MPRQSPRARYTRAEKAQAVGEAIVSGLTVASEKTGIPKSTLFAWFHSPEYELLRTKTRDEVADQMWATVQLAVAEVAKGVTDPDAPLRDKVVALGVLYDKHALLTGSATSRTESRDISGTLSDAEVRDLYREAVSVLAGGGDAAPAAGEAEG